MMSPDQGSVDSADEKEAAADLARAASDGRKVENMLTVRPAPDINPGGE